MSTAFLDGPDGGGTHLGDLASAYLDGELDAGQVGRAEAHLVACPSCAGALAAERSVRDAVRALGPVAVPDGFFEGLLAAGGAGAGPVDLAAQRRRRRVRVGLSQLAATAAVWLVVLGFGLSGTIGGADVAPQVPTYLQAHIAAASTLRASRGPAVPDVAAAADAELPATVARQLVLVRVRSEGDMLQALYRHGTTVVSVFVQPGDLDEADLPVDAERVRLGDVTGYRMVRPEVVVLVLERGAAVYTVVAPASTSTASLPEALPTRRTPAPSVLDRFESAGRGLVDCFGLAG